MDFQLWEYENAPAAVRRLLPNVEAGWWVALVGADNSVELAAFLASLWRSEGYSVAQYSAGEGTILLAVRRNPST